MPRPPRVLPAAELEQQSARLRQVNAEVAAAAGISPPRLRILTGTRSENVLVSPRLWLAGEPVLTYPAEALSVHDQDVLVGTLAHEHQHIVYRDAAGHRAWSAAARLGLTGLVVVGSLIAFPAIAVAVAHAVIASTPAVVVIALTAYAGVVAAMLWWGPRVFPFTRAGAADSRRRELRADLAAVRVVGAGPVLAMLEDVREIEERKDARVAEAGALLRVSRWLWSRRHPTHPDTSLRRSVVAAYDTSDDPDLAARAALGRG